MDPGSSVDSRPIFSVWFPDGNIILQAEDHRFKVYQGILAQESALFRDTLSLPQPSNDSSTELLDGCPLIRLQDTAADMGLFLAALYHFEFLNTCGGLDYIRLLRLASKYQVETLRMRVIKTLQHVYPDSLPILETVVNYGSTFPDHHPLCRLPLDDMDMHVALVNTAEAAGASILLPVAMLRIFTRGMEEIIHDQPSKALSSSDRDTILAAFPKLSTLARTHTFTTLYSEDVNISEDCMSLFKCQQAQRRLRRILERPARAHAVNPFSIVSFAKGRPAQDLCADCLSVFTSSYENGRARAWEKLPAVFDLPCWDKLRRGLEEGFVDRMVPVEGGGESL